MTHALLSGLPQGVWHHTGLWDACKHLLLWESHLLIFMFPRRRTEIVCGRSERGNAWYVT